MCVCVCVCVCMLNCALYLPQTTLQVSCSGHSHLLPRSSLEKRFAHTHTTAVCIPLTPKAKYICSTHFSPRGPCNNECILYCQQIQEVSVFSRAFSVGQMKLEISGKYKDAIFHTISHHIWSCVCVCVCVCVGEGGEIKFKAVAPLVAKENGYMSRALFKNISLSPREIILTFSLPMFSFSPTLTLHL